MVIVPVAYAASGDTLIASTAMLTITPDSEPMEADESPLVVTEIPVTFPEVEDPIVNPEIVRVTTVL